MRLAVLSLRLTVAAALAAPLALPAPTALLAQASAGACNGRGVGLARNGRATGCAATSSGSSTGGSPASVGTSVGGTVTSSPTPGTLLSREWSICGGPTTLSLMCAAVQVDVLGTTTTVRVRNFSGDPALASAGVASAGQWVLTTVGFDGVANAAGTFTTAIGASSGPSWQPSPATEPPDAWERFDDAQHGGGVNVDFGIDNGPGISGGIASSCAPASSLPGGSNRLWMTSVDGCSGYAIASATANDGWFETRFQTAETWDPRGNDVALMFKGQNGADGGSYECVVDVDDPRGGCVDADTYYARAGGPDGSVVPEPGTFLLMATGVVGVLVLAVRTRRGRG